jgi:PDZ domain
MTKNWRWLVSVFFVVALATGMSCSRSDVHNPSNHSTPEQHSTPAQYFKEHQAYTITPHGKLIIDSVEEVDGKIQYKTEDGKQWRVSYSKQADGTCQYGTPDEVKIQPGAAKTHNEDLTLYPIIIAVEAGSLASSVGIRRGDILLEYDGVPMNTETSTNDELKHALMAAKDKSEVQVKLYRMGSRVTVTVPGGKLLGIIYDVAK